MTDPSKEFVMFESNSVERVTNALARAERHWRTHHASAPFGGGPESPPPRAFTIALSREAGTPGTSVAREVGERLDWPVYDHELLERIAREMNLRTSLLESVDERQLSWLQECLEALASSGPVLSEGSFVHHLVATLLSLAAHGRCVIVGRGSALLLPASTTLRVRLTAPLADRVTAAAQRRGLPRAEAEGWVKETDRQRRRFILDHFHKDPAVVEQYDLVLNSSRFAVGECADLIVAALRTLQARLAAGPVPAAP